MNCFNLKFTLDYLSFHRAQTIEPTWNVSNHLDLITMFNFSQKFRFCGEIDCPDWVLAEIHSSLSPLTSDKLEILTQLVANSILGDEIPVLWFYEVFFSQVFQSTIQSCSVSLISHRTQSRFRRLTLVYFDTGRKTQELLHDEQEWFGHSESINFLCSLSTGECDTLSNGWSNILNGVATTGSSHRTFRRNLPRV